MFWSLNLRLLADDSVNKKIKFDTYFSNFFCQSGCSYHPKKIPKKESS